MGKIRCVGGEKSYSSRTTLFVAKDRFEEKGGLLLLEGFRLAQASDSRLKLIVVAPEQYREVAQSVPGVTFKTALPWDELEMLFNEASLFAMPAIYEPWGLVYVEALACRTPVLGMNRNSLPELTQNGAYGFLLDEATPSCVAEKLLDAYSSIDRLAAMGSRGQKYVRSRYGWDLTAERITGVLVESDSAQTVANRCPARPASSHKERILYCCHVDWGWIKQRPQHLAEHLRQYFDVTVAFSCNWRRAAMVNEFRMSRSCIPLLRVPMRGRFPLMARLDTLLLRLSLRFLIWLVRPSYIWLTWPDLYAYLPRHVRSSIVYDCMDDAQAFPREQERAGTLARVEHELVAHSQLVFVSSERLRGVLQSRHGTQKTYHLLRNAFDGKLLPAPPQSRPLRRVCQIGYCGTIATWLDWDLLVSIADTLPEIEFHLVGALDAGASIVHHSRIVWHGPKKHDELPAIMGEYDCLAMPFQVTPLIESVDPVKLYEYIGFGKPIVAVYYDEIARFAPFVHFYRTHEEAINLVARLTAGHLDRKYSESERQAFLAANSWTERASIVAALLMTIGAGTKGRA